MRQDPASARLVLGVAMASLGALFLLDNLHVFSARHVLSFWPVLLIAAGALKLSQARNPTGTAVGVGLILFGMALTLSHMGWISLRWRDWWPLLLIGLGILVIFNGHWRSQHDGTDGAERVASSDDQVQHTTIMGGTETRLESQNFKGGELTVIMGGIELDLRGASITDEAHLQVFVAMGGIEIRVPSDWTVTLDVVPILAGTENKTIPAAQAGKRLRISGYLIMGGLELKN